MDDNANDPSTLPGRKTPATAGQGPLALGSPGRDLIDRALGMRDARLDDEGTPHVGPLALGSPGRDLIARALGMRDARLDDEGQPHNSPLALGSPGRERIRNPLDMRDFQRDDPGDTTDERAASPAVMNLARRQARGAPQAPQGQGHAPALTPQQSHDFAVANQHYEASHMQSLAPNQSQGAPRKGWGPAARIGSYNARHPGGSNAPYGGDPTQAPDYVEPKGKGGK